MCGWSWSWGTFNSGMRIITLRYASAFTKAIHSVCRINATLRDICLSFKPIQKILLFCLQPCTNSFFTQVWLSAITWVSINSVERWNSCRYNLYDALVHVHAPPHTREVFRPLDFFHILLYYSLILKLTQLFFNQFAP